MNVNRKIKLFVFVSTAVLLALLLTACGSAGNPALKPTAMPVPNIPTMSKTENMWSYGDYVFAADGLTTVLGKPFSVFDLVGLVIKDEQYSLKTGLFKPSCRDCDWKVWIDLHSVNDGNITGVFSCYWWNGHSSLLYQDEYNAVGAHLVTEQIEVFCPLKGGTLYIWYWAKVEDEYFKALMDADTPSVLGTELTTPMPAPTPSH